MKACEKILLFAQHELPDNEQQMMRQHIQTCTDCQKELAFLSQLEAALIPPAAPAETVDKLFAKTTRRTTTVFSRWKKLVFAGMSMAILGLLCWNITDSSTPFDTQEVVAYMNTHLEREYQNLEEDLAALEEDF